MLATTRQYPRDGECGASSTAWGVRVEITLRVAGEHVARRRPSRTRGAAFRVYARCQDQQLAMAAMGGLPLYLDVAEARPAHATAWALLPDAPARRGLQAALAQVAAARPPPGWAVAVLAGDRHAASRGVRATWAPRGRRRRRPWKRAAVVDTHGKAAARLVFAGRGNLIIFRFVTRRPERESSNFTDGGRFQSHPSRPVYMAAMARVYAHP